MRISEFDLGWLIGLIEGDGCFTFDGRYPVVALKITDLDVAQRFAALMQTTVFGPYQYEDQQLGPKPYWISKLVGPRAKDFMRSTMLQFSERRQQQIENLLGRQFVLGIDAPLFPHIPTDTVETNTQGDIP